MNKPLLHVAVGVLEDQAGRILIAKRPEHAPQGGSWEFPGGKIEPGETPIQGLARELEEELAVTASAFEPLIKIPHDYPERSVLLDVWRVMSYRGKAVGREGQSIRWVSRSELAQYAFPEANTAIVNALRLPEYYGVLEGHSEQEVRANLAAMLSHRVGLVQFRLKSLVSPLTAEFFDELKTDCVNYGVDVLTNSSLALSERAPCDGLHLTSSDLFRYRQRPTGLKWWAASCHDQRELVRAAQLGVDFVVLAPVLRTATHPNAAPLGWDKFADLTVRAPLPIFALGGLQVSDLKFAKAAGAQGIAGISMFRT